MAGAPLQAQVTNLDLDIALHAAEAKGVLSTSPNTVRLTILRSILSSSAGSKLPPFGRWPTLELVRDRALSRTI